MRADARRNRQRVLDAAAAVFATHGADVPIDLIARAAGVGPGTLYRHFPNKEALFEAVLLDRFAQLTEQARSLLHAPDPGPAFLGYIERLVVQAADRHDVVDALTRAGFDMQSVNPRPAPTCVTQLTCCCSARKPPARCAATYTSPT